MNINEIAEAYVVNYSLNNPHDREEAQLEELGVGHDRLVYILDLHDLAREGEVNAMSEHEYAEAVDAAVRDIVSAVGERREEDVVYGVVDMPRSGTGDTWATVCASEAEAREKARDDWHRLTHDERHRRTICAAVGRLDDDGKFYLGEYTPIEVHEDVFE